MYNWGIQLFVNKVYILYILSGLYSVLEEVVKKLYAKRAGRWNFSFIFNRRQKSKTEERKCLENKLILAANCLDRTAHC